MDRRTALYAVKAFVTVVVSLCAAYLFFVIGPLAESKYFPVVGKLEIITVNDAGGGKSYITAQFTKKRDCEYIGVAWYRIMPNGVLERISMITHRQEGDTSSPNRPLGKTVAGPWEVSMPHTQVRGLSVVEVFHRCHPFWTTRTPFYP